MQTNSSKFSRRYDREFKENAVALIQSGRSITEVSRDLGVSDWSLRQWLKTIEGAQALNESKRLSSETPEQREIRRLRQENDYLRRQRDILKSLQHLVGRGAAQRFRVMQQMRASHSLTEMADALAVSKSGFFAHQRKGERPRARQDNELSQAIEPIFVASRKTYGSPRIMHALRRSGWRYGKNRIARLMRSRGLRARQKRRFRPQITRSDHKLPVAPNWLAKIPKPDRPGQVWLADITCIQTQEGWLYLSGVLDHCSRRCIGWHAQESLASSLVSRVWEKACLNQPIAPGLLHHSDRGVQYASTQFQTLLHSRGATASMSRKANPYDNAIMESFFATLKTECFQNQIPKSRREAKLILLDYFETFYNRSRLHSALQYQSPLEFENKFNTNN
jgi:putative transposase